MKIFYAIAISLFLFFTSFLYAQEYSKSFMQEEKCIVEYFEKKSSELRSRIEFSTKKIPTGKNLVYRYTSHGEGSYDEFDDVIWDVNAEMEEREEFLYPLFSDRTIKDKQGNVLVEYQRRYDYQKGKINFTKIDGSGKVLKKLIFPVFLYSYHAGMAIPLISDTASTVSDCCVFVVNLILSLFFLLCSRIFTCSRHLTITEDGKNLMRSVTLTDVPPDLPLLCFGTYIRFFLIRSQYSSIKPLLINGMFA